MFEKNASGGGKVAGIYPLYRMCKVWHVSLVYTGRVVIGAIHLSVACFEESYPLCRLLGKKEASWKTIIFEQHQVSSPYFKDISIIVVSSLDWVSPVVDQGVPVQVGAAFHS